MLILNVVRMDVIDDAHDDDDDGDEYSRGFGVYDQVGQMQRHPEKFFDHMREMVNRLFVYKDSYGKDFSEKVAAVRICFEGKVDEIITGVKANV